MTLEPKAPDNSNLRSCRKILHSIHSESISVQYILGGSLYCVYSRSAVSECGMARIRRKLATGAKINPNPKPLLVVLLLAKILFIFRRFSLLSNITCKRYAKNGLRTRRPLHPCTRAAMASAPTQEEAAGSPQRDTAPGRRRNHHTPPKIEPLPSEPCQLAPVLFSAFPLGTTDVYSFVPKQYFPVYDSRRLLFE